MSLLMNAAAEATPGLGDIAADILDHIEEAFCAIAPDGRVTYANRRASEMTGLARASIVGHPIWDCFPGLCDTELCEPGPCEPGSRENDGGQSLRRAIEAGAPSEFEAFCRGSERSLAFRVRPVGPGLIGVFWRDTTTRRRREDDLRAHEERLRLAIEAGRMTAWERIPGEDVVRFYSGTASVDRPEHRLDGLRAQLHPDDAPLARAAFDAALAGDGQYACEYRARNSDGTWRWVADRGIVHRDALGRPARVVGVARDITERRQAEKAVCAIEERLRLAQQGAGLGIWDWDLETDDVYWSPQMYRLLGVDPVRNGGDLLAAWRSVVHPDDRAAAQAASARRRFDAEPSEFDFRIVRPDGTVRWLLAKGMAVSRDAAGRAVRIAGISIDITERKRAEAELRELSESLEARIAARTRDLADLNERLRRERVLSALILENTAEGIIVADPDLRYRVWNAGMERIDGRRRCDLLGRTVFELFPHEIDGPVGAAWRDAVAGRRTELRGCRYFADARGVEVVYDADFNPLYDQAGAIVGAVAIVRDISERHRIEEKLRQSQKLEAVAQLTGGVAHDFNNLLTAVIGCLDLISYQAEGERIRRLAATALRSAERGSRLTRQLLAFSRRQALRPVPADLNALLADIEALVRRAVGETVDIVVDAAPGLSSCKLDPGQFEAAVLNLVINARDAMPEGGRLTLRTRDIAPQKVPAELDLPPGAYVAFAVHDTGSGMAPEIAARAFEPFFTTKEIGKGSGLGLSMVYGFARQSGGGARIDSAPGEGTCITVYLPRAASGAAAEHPDIGDAATSGSGSVLVVEDDDEVREVSVATLRGLGYRVSVARDGPAALSALRRPDPVDLLFTDLVMPRGLSGVALARRARTIRPGIRVLLTTGYAGLESAAANEFPMILKPFRPAELSRRVAELIDPGDDAPSGDGNAGLSYSTGSIS